MNHIGVHSSNISSIAHSGDKLQVRFKSGQTWEYSPVTQDQHAALMNSTSKGQHFSQHIKNAGHISGRKI